MLPGTNIEPINYSKEAHEILDRLYHQAPEKMTLPDGRHEEIPASGNLGLLSLGYTGLLAIRKKREKIFGEKIQFPLLDYLKKQKKQK